MSVLPPEDPEIAYYPRRAGCGAEGGTVQVNLAEWIRGTVVVGPADEPMLRRAELLEGLYESVLLEQRAATMDREEVLSIDWKDEADSKREILAELAREV